MATSADTKTVIETTPEGVRVLMPTPRVGCVAVFLGFWMLGWAAGEYAALRGLFSLLSGGEGPVSIAGAAFLLFWLAGWTAGGVVFGCFFLMMLDGREILTVGGGIIRRRVEAFRWGLSWRYPIERCSNLRPTGGSDDAKSFISFDFAGTRGDKTIRLGSGLTEETTEQIAEQIWAAYPALMPRLTRLHREKMVEPSA